MRTIVNVNFVDAFSEADHPREGGKFTSKGGGKGSRGGNPRTSKASGIEKAGPAHLEKKITHQEGPYGQKTVMTIGEAKKKFKLDRHEVMSLANGHPTGKHHQGKSHIFMKHHEQ